MARNEPSSERTSPLWTCPKCGLKLVGKNMWHSCGYATLEDWLARMGPRGRGLYRRFERLIALCGEYHVSPAKTRIAFLGRVRFAGVTRVSEQGMVCNFAMPYRLRSRRFRKVEEVVPGWWSHQLYVSTKADLDEQVQEWLRRSYELMGMRGRLKSRTRRGRRSG
jgi:hypothetical protein